jgi:hypothetical protein
MQYFLKTFFDSNLGKPLENPVIYENKYRFMEPIAEFTRPKTLNRISTTFIIHLTATFSPISLVGGVK